MQSRPLRQPYSHDIQSRTGARWATVMLIVGAGIVSAFQVGEVSIALSTLQSDFGVSLVAAGWLISAFAAVGALTGIWIGVSVDALGARRMALAGLVTQGLCSLCAAAAGSFAALLALRVLEGLGFLAVVVAAPSLILVATHPDMRARAFAALGTFMPLGVATAMLCASLIGVIGWKGLNAASGVALLAYAVLFARGTRHLSLPGPAGPASPTSFFRFAEVRKTVAARGPWVLTLLFALFSAAYFSVFAFLPDILVERLAFAPANAGLLAALAVAVNAAGNLVSGALLTRGVAGTALLRAGFLGIAVCTAGVLAPDVPGVLLYASCLALSFVSGFIPVVLLEAAPRRAPAPEDVGATVGLLMQGNNIGLLAGPAVAAWIASTWSWSWVAAWVAGLALPALSANRWLQRTPARN